MHFLYILCCVVSFVNLSVQHSEEYASCGQHEKSKYSESANQWPVYLEKINQAKAEHAGCGRSDAGCTECHDGVITENLSPFKDGITPAMMDQAANVTRITKYQIFGHKLYRSEGCMFPFRCRGIEHFLLEILDQVPDTEFYLNTRDWPMAGKYFGSPVPVFSFSKTADYWDIMYPAWTFWEGGPALKIYPTGLGRWDEYVKKLKKASSDNPWESKVTKAFFRGSRTSSERDPLVLLSRKCGDLVNAEYTKNQAWKSTKDTLGAQPAEEVPLEDHCRFKYLFNYRGVAASFRFKHLFLCNSLVFHVGNEWLEFFYPALRPWYHYIPVSSQASQDDIQSLLEFARHHDAEMRQIADNGAKFITEHLQFRDIFCYWKTLLLSYTKLLRYDVTKDNNLIEII